MGEKASFPVKEFRKHYHTVMTGHSGLTGNIANVALFATVMPSVGAAAGGLWAAGGTLAGNIAGGAVVGATFGNVFLAFPAEMLAAESIGTDYETKYNTMATTLWFDRMSLRHQLFKNHYVVTPVPMERVKQEILDALKWMR
jgi:hypothetical protein